MLGPRAVLGGAVVLVVGFAAWARGALPPAAPEGEPRALRHALETTSGELELVRLQLARAEAIIGYSALYDITADVAAAVYDIALAEGVNPELAFRLVKTESDFSPTARSAAGAAGYTQILPSTARLYEPGLTLDQIYEPRTNLRLGFRYLRDLLDRYQGTPDETLRLALLAYNRGPAKVAALLGAGRDPRNGYAERVIGRPGS